jgi:membrane protease YdiL (CAAX protease family)
MASINNESASVLPGNNTDDSYPPPLSNKAKVLLSYLEVFWCLVEYFFLLVFGWLCWSWLVQKKWLPDVHNHETSVDRHDNSTNSERLWIWWQQLFIGFVLSFLDTSLVLLFLLFRYRDLIYRCHRNLPPFLGMNRRHLSPLCCKLIAFHVLSFVIAVCIQWFTGNWIFSLSNFLDHQQTKIDYFKVFEFIMFIPLKEEIIFRGIIYYLLYNREPSPLYCAVVSNCCFGLFHLVNLFGSGFSTSYVLLQIGLGVEVGLVYSLCFILSGTIWECVILHIINNLVSGFVSSAIQPDFSNPIICTSILTTATVYGILLISMWKNIRKVTESKTKQD